MINRYRHPVLAWILDSWPAMILLPSVLLLIAALVLITRWWDERDAARETVRRDAYSPEGSEAADSVMLSEPTAA
jgi:hypothetical protein